jgi:hypothetical protein
MMWARKGREMFVKRVVPRIAVAVVMSGLVVSVSGYRSAITDRPEALSATASASPVAPEYCCPACWCWIINHL